MNRCQYRGKPLGSGEGNIDHVLPRSRGGKTSWENCVLASKDVNSRKGDRLPDSYRSNQYVVNDWQSRHLRQPPSGYHWVQVNGDYVLAAIATGVIADMLLNN